MRLKGVLSFVLVFAFVLFAYNSANAQVVDEIKDAAKKTADVTKDIADKTKDVTVDAQIVLIRRMMDNVKIPEKTNFVARAMKPVIKKIICE